MDTTTVEKAPPRSASVNVPGLLAWFVAGALISIGIVGFFTGLVLVPIGIALAAWASNRKLPDISAFVVGLGMGPLVLFRDEWQAFQRHGCIPDTSPDMDQGPDCMGVYTWGYRIGLALVVIGVVLLVAQRIRVSTQR